MPRPGIKSSGDQPPRVPADRKLLEADLAAWAGEHIAAAGRREALLGRVEMLRIASDGRSIAARIRGNRPLPYQVEVRASDRGLVSRCTCARAGLSPCKHAVAAIEALRFPLPTARGAGRRSRQGRAPRGRGRIVQPAASQPGFLVIGGAERTLTREERVDAARKDEILVRKQGARRGRRKVWRLPGQGGPPRVWVSGTRAAPGREVTLRGARGELASCTCDDFARNELGTCAHVERARSWWSRRKREDVGPFVSVWCHSRVWSDRVPDPLLEIRIHAADAPLPSMLAPFFDADGWLVPAPDDRPPHVWAREAVETARAAARRDAVAFDLDREVRRRIDEAARAWAFDRRMEAVGAEAAVWRSVSDRLGLRLHPYQNEGALFLAHRGRALLADEMGLGKTVQAIAAALLLRDVAAVRRVLVVCPASLKYQWKREIAKACGETATVVDATRPRRLAAYGTWREGFLVLNYELVLKDLAELREIGADLVILDEAQRIKNWDTKTARAVKLLRGRFAFILTGTPLENRLPELHSLVEFLHPRALGPRWRLLPFHAVTEAPGRVIAYEGLDVLRRRIRGFFLRRERASVLDQLPERTENTYWTGMTTLQRRPYRRHAATVAALVGRNQPLTPADVRKLLQSLTSMRILCNAWAQYAWTDVAPRIASGVPPERGEVRAMGSPKLEEFVRVLEDLLDESETKIVVFSQWERMLRLAHWFARELLDRRDLRAEVFHGGLSALAREELLEAFRLDPEFRVLFSTDAGGLGLNLQESASIVVNLEVPWNPAVLEQRIGRVHRLGQRRGVQVLHFVTRGAVEERVRQVVEEKRALFEGLLNDDVDHVSFDEGSRATFVQRVRNLVDTSV